MEEKKDFYAPGDSFHILDVSPSSAPFSSLAEGQLPSTLFTGLFFYLLLVNV